MEKEEESEAEIAVVGSKGQIVIPQQFRRRLKIAPKTKVAIYRRSDKLVITTLKIPPLREKLTNLFKTIDREYPKTRRRPDEKEILDEIQDYRLKKRSK